ncbi:MAG: tetratricopeptide repeat protein, partial [Alistipes sp.]|nr:tetratricopeptide repeat protein [Alistipes sp.]
NSTDIQGKTDVELMAAANQGQEMTVEEYLFTAQELAKTPEQAVAFLKEAAKQYPNDARVWNNLGVALTKAGEKAEALEAFEKAAKVDPSADLNKNLLLANLANGNTAAAKKYAAAADGEAKAAVAAAEGNYQAAAAQLEGYNAAIAYVMNNDLAAAKKALANEVSADADYLRAVIAAKEGQVAQAKAQLKSAIAKAPELAEKAAKDVLLKAIMEA